MKKLLLALFGFSVGATSCHTQPQQSASTMSRADSFVVRFRAQHPDMGKNEIKMAEADTDFVRKVKSFVKDSNGLAGMPLKIVSMAQQKNKEFSIVHFDNVKAYERHTDYSIKDGPQEINIDLFAVIPTDSAKQLEQGDGKWYSLEAYAKVVNVDKATDLVSDDIIYTNKANISKTSNGKEYNFGNYMLTPTRVIPYEHK